ncbi:MAG: hypothetical protein AAEJ52_09625 [Myxococcota bacterium]
MSRAFAGLVERVAAGGDHHDPLSGQFPTLQIVDHDGTIFRHDDDLRARTSIVSRFG